MRDRLKKAEKGCPNCPAKRSLRRGARWPSAEPHNGQRQSLRWAVGRAEIGPASYPVAQTQNGSAQHPETPERNGLSDALFRLVIALVGDLQLQKDVSGSIVMEIP